MHQRVLSWKWAMQLYKNNKLQFFFKVIVRYFMIRIWRYCLKALAWPKDVLTLLNEGIAHLVYSTNVIHPWWMQVLCVTWHKMISKSINPKIKTSGLIQRSSSNHTTKRMVTKNYHIKLICNALIQKWCICALKLYLKIIPPRKMN